MKTRIFFVLAFVFTIFQANAQSPYAFNYQSVVRDTDGNILTNTPVGLQLTLLKSSASGTVVFQESHALTTNSHGLINVQIGTGTISYGLLDTISWGANPYFLQIGMDFTGGSNYQVLGTTQLVSVPYALHARTADSLVGGIPALNENDPVFGSSVAYHISSADTAFWNTQTVDTQIDSIGITSLGFVAGPHTIDTKLTETEVDNFVANNGYLTMEQDSSITNELQSISISNDTIYLSNGGHVKLPVAVVGFNGQYTSLTGAPTNVSHFTNDAGYLTNEVDGSITNEIQDLQLVGNTMTITNNSSATSIDLSAYLDNTDTQLTESQVDAFVANNGYLTNEIDGSITNEIQDLQLVGNSLTITNNTSASSIDLSAYLDNTDTQLTEAQVDAFVANNGYLTNEIDGSVTNEIQSLSKSNDTIYLSNGGGSITLPSSIWDTNSVGVYYGKNMALGGNPLSNRAITVHGDSLNASVMTQFGTSSNFNYLEFVARDVNSRISVGMGNTTYNNAFTVGTALSNTWTDPLIIDLGAPTNTIKVANNGYVGFGEANPQYIIHATGDSTTIHGFSNGQHANNWKNVGVLGESNTNANPGRGISGGVYGTNAGEAIRGEAGTDSVNYGVSGISLSNSSNSSNQFGVYGEARKAWGASNSGTGNHFGGYFVATGEGTYNIGAYAVGDTPSASNNRGIEGVANSNSASINIGGAMYATGTISGFNRGIYAQASNSSSTNYGIQGESYGSSPNQTGVYGYTAGTGAMNIGVDGTSTATGTENIGVGGYAYGTNTGANKNYGVYAYAENADTNYGVYATVTGTNLVNYGVYAKVSGGTNGNVPVYAINESTNGGNSILAINESVTSNINFGVNGRASNSTNQNQGVLGFASGSSTYEVGVHGASNGSGTNGYGVYGSATGSTNNFAGYFNGDVTVTGNLNVTGSISKGSGTFKIDHPLDPANKYLVHSFVESPEMMNVYSGNIVTDVNGFATVELPDYFEAANKDFRYQLTVIGSFAQAIVKEKIKGNQFVVQTNNPNVEVSWQVTGVRSDKYAEANRIVPELEKTKKGTYLHPEVYGVSADQYENAESNNLSTESVNSSKSSGINSSTMKSFMEGKKETNNVAPSPRVSQPNQQPKKMPVNHSSSNKEEISRPVK